MLSRAAAPAASTRAASTSRRVRAMSAPSASRLSGGLSRRFDDSGSVLLRCTAGR
ncbi:hypothetical protein ACGFNP_52225 [Nonomuraea sp. NPDC049269]|uniref:hypothetical protein n=1 Tax=Nonomuraea sp. NPDC049269 TaxID=3364349 RepID=UPI00371B708D